MSYSWDSECVTPTRVWTGRGQTGEVLLGKPLLQRRLLVISAGVPLRDGGPPVSIELTREVAVVAPQPVAPGRRVARWTVARCSPSVPNPGT